VPVTRRRATEGFGAMRIPGRKIGEGGEESRTGTVGALDYTRKGWGDRSSSGGKCGQPAALYQNKQKNPTTAREEILRKRASVKERGKGKEKARTLNTDLKRGWRSIVRVEALHPRSCGRTLKRSLGTSGWVGCLREKSGKRETGKSNRCH